MKKTYFLLFLIILSCKTFDYKGKTDITLKGKPKKLQVTLYEAIKKDDKIIKGKIKYTEISLFDKKNRKYKSYYIKSNGDTIGENCKKIYDKKSLTIKSGCVKSDSSFVISAIYRLNKDFKKSVFEFYNNNKLYSKRVYEYKKNGVDFIEYGYDESNKIKDKAIILHDKKNRKFKTISFNPKDNSVKTIIQRDYNETDNYYEQNWYKKGVKYLSFSNRKFDKNGNLIYSERLRFNKSDTIKSISTIEYKYDRKDNIIYQLSITDQKPKYIEERMITY